MQTIAKAEAAAWLREHDRFCILTHRRPDGDTTGSAAALCLGLRRLGKRAVILHNPQLTPRLAFLHDGLSVPAPAPDDTLISVDVAAANMLPQPELAERVALRIDHHALGTPFAPLELVDAAAAACGEIVFELLQALNVPLDRELALALYVAVSTDTGCFRYANTRAESFSVAAACAATGCDLFTITQALFGTNSLEKLRLQSWMLEHTRFLCDGRGAICTMPYEVERKVSPDEMESISSFLRTIEGVELAALLRQGGSGTKLSVRAAPNRNAAAVCAHFGGGGHAGAAGATLSLPLEQAAAQVEPVLRAALEEA